MNKIQQYITETEKEFDKMAYPIIHSNTFPEKDKEYLTRFESFLLSRQLGLIELVRILVPKEREDSDAWADDDQRSIFNDGFNAARKEIINYLEKK